MLTPDGSDLLERAKKLPRGEQVLLVLELAEHHSVTYGSRFTIEIISNGKLMAGPDAS